MDSILSEAELRIANDKLETSEATITELRARITQLEDILEGAPSEFKPPNTFGKNSTYEKHSGRARFLRNLNYTTGK
jgi:hypothetical protein